MTDDSPRCANCRFWNRNPREAEIGECRRYPPRINDAIMAHDLSIDTELDPFDMPVARSIWPGTNDTEWCGEHSLAPE